MASRPSEHWQDEPQAQDFLAAENYLSLLVGRPVARKLAKALRKEPVLEHFAAKDILRARAREAGIFARGGSGYPLPSGSS
jgi:hypothetical protein